MPLLTQPGTHWRYSYGYDVLGVLLFKVTGQSPDVWMKQVCTYIDTCTLYIYIYFCERVCVFVFLIIYTWVGGVGDRVSDGRVGAPTCG